MHAAYECSNVLEKFPLQIEAIDVYDDKLIVGTRQGNLLIYQVRISGSGIEDSDSSVQLVTSNKFFSKKPIIQLSAVSENEILISLSDYLVSINDLSCPSVPVISSVKKSKGATLFAVNVKSETSLTGEKAAVIRLVVAVKRKLQVYYWKSREFLDLVPDLLLPDTPRALGWVRESICVGIRGEYMLLRTNGDTKELFFTGKIPEPTIATLLDDRFLLGKDDLSIFVDIDGIPSEEKIKWSEAPSCVVDDSPYVIGVTSPGLEIHSYEPWLQIQKIEIPRVKFLRRVQGKRACLFAASQSQIWCLTSVPVDIQLPALMSEKLFGLAIKLATISDEAPEVQKEQIQKIQSIQAFDFFCNRQFKDAMTLFLQLETDPSHVIGLYPDLLPDSVRKQFSYPEDIPVLQGKDLENGLVALVEYLTEVRRHLQGNIKSVAGPSPALGNHTAIKTKNQLLQIIDTSLLKCYLKTNDALVSSLLRLKDNNCHVEETEQVLKKNSKWGELVILYQSKGLHKKALDLLKDQALKSPELPLGNHMRTVSYLQHLGVDHLDLILHFSDWVLCAHPKDGIKIFTEDIQEVEYLPRGKVLDYLSRLHRHLVLPYLEHVVYAWADTNALYHNKLAISYIERILRLMSLDGTDPVADVAGTCSPLPDLEEYTNLCSSPSSVTSHASSLNGDSTLLAEFRRRFQFFIETSSSCSWETVLTHMPKDALLEEKAFIFGRLGRHQEALRVFVNNLNDVRSAERYCEREYKSSAQAKDVYVTLLKLLLTSKDEVTGEVLLEEALKLVDTAGAKIRPDLALPILPDGVPLQRLFDYLVQALNTSGSERHSLTLLKGLIQADYLQLRYLKSNIQGTRVVLRETDVCHVCKKRFTNQSAFVRNPNGTLVHYSCNHERPAHE